MRLALAALALLPLPAPAQELSPVEPLPAAALALLSETGAPEHSTGWQGDLDGDGDADLLAQGAYTTGDGGNAATLKQMLLRAEGEGYSLWREIVLPEGVKSARLEAGALILTLYKYLPDDPHCCPSGEEPFRLPLD